VWLYIHAFFIVSLSINVLVRTTLFLYIMYNYVRQIQNWRISTEGVRDQGAEEYSVFHNECPNFKTLYFCNHEPQMNETYATWTAVAWSFQQGGAPPHWHNQVSRFLNETLPQRWIGRTGLGTTLLAPKIGRTGPKDLALHSWPPTLDARDPKTWHYTLGPQDSPHGPQGTCSTLVASKNGRTFPH
jgi:hypothetical protein